MSYRHGAMTDADTEQSLTWAGSEALPGRLRGFGLGWLGGVAIGRLSLRVTPRHADLPSRPDVRGRDRRRGL
jgi:hypothetical protein